MSEDRNKESAPIAMSLAGTEDAERDLLPRKNPEEAVSITGAGSSEAQGCIEVFFNVFDKDRNMTTHLRYCDLGISIEGLKSECAKLFGAIRYQQEWHCNNKELEDDKTLSYYKIDGITKGAIINVDIKN